MQQVENDAPRFALVALAVLPKDPRLLIGDLASIDPGHQIGGDLAQAALGVLLPLALAIELGGLVAWS
jgi:hypothetical protein